MTNNNSTIRPWGRYTVLHTEKTCKVKELYVEPYGQLSMQRHFLRNELWLVISGSCTLYSKLDSGYSLPPKNLNTHDFIMIDKNSWHQLSNPYDVACRLIEIQFGEDCIESDIERM